MNILLCITGSIAAFKIIELTHELKKNNHSVKVVLTKDAMEFVTPLSFAAFDVEVFHDEKSNHIDPIKHISLARWPDIIVVAPLSANTMAKIANGIADNLLTATILATTAPVYLVPAMNMHMWNNRITQFNVTKLKEFNFVFWGPDKGIQACGDDGSGRMIEASEILANIIHYTLKSKKSFKNKKVVITVGATEEAIDPIRYLTNHSSGKMGFALARAFASYEANVFIIKGNTLLTPPFSASKIINVKSAKEMHTSSIYEIADADIFVAAAAVGDFSIKNYSQNKIKKNENGSITLEFIKNPDVVLSVKQSNPNLFVVGFAAETENLIENAKNKLLKKNLDLIVANNVNEGQVFGSEENEVSIIDKNLLVTKISKNSKDVIAHEIINFIPNEM